MEKLISLSDELAKTFYLNRNFLLAYDQALITYRLAPNNFGVIFNLAKMCFVTQKYEEAILLMNKCYELANDNEDVLREASLYLAWIGDFDQSEQILKKLPQDSHTKYNTAFHELRRGNFIEGMTLLEQGREFGFWGNKRKFSHFCWDGIQSLKDKQILLCLEGGLGDEVIMVRYASYFKTIGAKEVVVKCDKSFTTVFSRIEGIDSVVSHEDFQPILYQNYIHINGLSCPSLVKKDNPVSSNIAYLKPSKKYLDKFKKILPSGYKIGIRWQGGSEFEMDHKRTLPARGLYEVLKDKGNLISLQKDAFESCPKGVENLENKLKTWEDTIACISLMDIVVTSCTSIAHVAGALGKKTIVISPIVPYFTWANDNIKWYPNVKVLRQTNPHDWDEEINQLITIM